MTGEGSEDSTCILLDTCCLLNLYATGRIADILYALPARFAVVERVLSESLYIRRGEVTGDEDDTEPVLLQPLVELGLLEVLQVENDDEAASFVSFAAELDDGEAMTCALALHRTMVVATDDRKATRLCGLLNPPLSVQTTAAMIRSWADARQIPHESLRQVLSDVRERARFAPGRHDPLHAWWHAVLHSEE
ncbi:hypothetical protein [Nitrolancea hollandica]|uniref:PIN domain-containing protein n=1 Tax=Nitrolancea hollandica Lb TaxID=1129897 RepID=I4EGF6_9BACT|nr:hypothetical protein [Nitrolancea hollandica]CCF83768.1 conserved hypothetical protein [Nitrolancea hollandica Lb]